ncbi:MAG TPA: hypothetical protein VFJ82_05600 [Longimicrobium sp.]|nr:hypothetical protein [Longimicrobium sp.]
MYQVVGAAALAAAILLAPSGARSQDRAVTRRVAALNAVIDYRLNWMNDSTTFDACSVYRTVGPPQQVAAGLLLAFRGWFTATAQPCASTPVDRNRERRVLVDSLTVTDSTARVYVTVRRGEQTHNEAYDLFRPGSDTWAVRQVVLSRAIRNYWIRRGASPPP